MFGDIWNEKTDIRYFVLDFLIVDLNSENFKWKLYFFLYVWIDFSLIRNFIEKRPVLLDY